MKIHRVQMYLIVLNNYFFEKEKISQLHGDYFPFVTSARSFPTGKGEVGLRWLKVYFKTFQFKITVTLSSARTFL